MDHSNVIEKAGNSSLWWQRKAESLIRSAEVLREHTEEFGEQHWSELLIWGFAVEVLLKSLYLRNGRVLYEYGRQIRLKTHNLVLLAAEANFDLDAEKECVLTELTKTIYWAGRYPVQGGGKELESVYWNGDQAYGVLDQIIADLRKRLACGAIGQ